VRLGGRAGHERQDALEAAGLSGQQETTVRLTAESREVAAQRIRDALGDGAFNVQRAEPEPPE
jgi:hypothetical protein